MAPTSWSGDPWVIKPKPPLTQTLLHLLLHTLICQRNPDLYVSWLHSEVDLKAVLARSATPAANWLSSLLLLLLLVNELSCPAVNLSRRRCVWIVVTSAPPPDHAALVQQHYTSDAGTNLRMRSTAGFIQICLRLWPCYVQGKCQNIPFWPLRGPFSGRRGDRKKSRLFCFISSVTKLNSSWFSCRLDWRYQCFHHGSMEKKHIFLFVICFGFFCFFLDLSQLLPFLAITFSFCCWSRNFHQSLHGGRWWKIFFFFFFRPSSSWCWFMFFFCVFFPSRAQPKPSVKKNK